MDSNNSEKNKECCEQEVLKSCVSESGPRSRLQSYNWPEDVPGGYNEFDIVESTPDRRNVWLVQTPQVFEYRSIYDAYKAAIESGREDITDDSMVMESFGNKEIHFVQGNYDNIKLTTPEDMIHGMAILRAKMEL